MKKKYVVTVNMLSGRLQRYTSVVIVVKCMIIGILDWSSQHIHQ